MKNLFRKILVFIIIILGLLYTMRNLVTELKHIKPNENELSLNEKGSLGNPSNINPNESKPNLDEKDKLVNSNSIHTKTEMILVNSEHSLSKDYIPEELTVPNISFAAGVEQEERHVAGIIAEPLEELVNAAKEEGIILLGNSGYRSYKSQEDTYTGRVKAEGVKTAGAYVAKPGFSEHQTGLCIDITNEGRYFVKGTKEADWLEENCYRFGFIIRYPYGKKNITGIEYEPWHIRYVGKEAAKYIYDNGITLEEYLGKWRDK